MKYLKLLSLLLLFSASSLAEENAKEGTEPKNSNDSQGEIQFLLNIVECSQIFSKD